MECFEELEVTMQDDRQNNNKNDDVFGINKCNLACQLSKKQLKKLKKKEKWLSLLPEKR